MSATDLGNEPNFCPKCGVKIPQVGSKFCSSCGFSLQSTQQSILPAVNSNLNSSNITSNTAKPVDYSKQNVSSGLKWDMITPEKIKNATGEFVYTSEIKLMIYFIFIFYLSHIFRFFILMDYFPSIIDLISPYFIYFLITPSIFLLRKYIFRINGVNVTFHANKFYLTASLVFSSFFLTYIPIQTKINDEGSQLPSHVYIQQKSDNGLQYVGITKDEYYDTKLVPKMHFIFNFILMIIVFIILNFYANSTIMDYNNLFRLSCQFLSSYIFVELAPLYGRSNKYSSSYGRIRTLLVFIMSLIFIVVSILGNQFISALQNLVP